MKKTKPANKCSILDHVLECNNKPSVDEITVLAYGKKKYSLKLKESLLIKFDKPILNRNISSTEFYLFEKV